MATTLKRKEIVMTWDEMADMAKEEIEAECSFCGLLVKDVEYMVAGPDNVYICSECIDTCAEMLKEKRKKDENRPESET
jgi:hypothetical protein